MTAGRVLGAGLRSSPTAAADDDHVVSKTKKEIRILLDITFVTFCNNYHKCCSSCTS